MKTERCQKECPSDKVRNEKTSRCVKKSMARKKCEEILAYHSA